MLEITERTLRDKQAFWLYKDERRIGELTFSKTKEKELTIWHTGIKKAEEGQGYGEKLVEHAVTYARSHSFVINPVCPFAKKVLESTPEYQDVLIDS